MHKVERTDICQISQDLQQYSTASAELTRLLVHARKGIYSLFVGGYNKNGWSRRIIVRGKKKETNRWQEATRKREGSYYWGNRKLRLPASRWTRNITASVSLKPWHNLGILSCEEHGVDKNKHRRGKSYPPVFHDHKGLSWGPDIYVRCSTSGLFAPAHWSTRLED